MTDPREDADLSGETVNSIELIERLGNIAVARLSGRKYPGLFVQGDTLRALLSDIDEAAPDSLASETVREWLAAYEEVTLRSGWSQVPYHR